MSKYNPNHAQYCSTWYPPLTQKEYILPQMIDRKKKVRWHDDNRTNATMTRSYRYRTNRLPPC